jgi:hypothetical protein
VKRPHSNAPTNASKTDWKRRDALSDADIDFSETPEVRAERFAHAALRKRVEPLRRERTGFRRQ